MNAGSAERMAGPERVKRAAAVVAHPGLAGMAMAAGLGFLMLCWPALWTPVWAYAVLAGGVVAVLAGLTGRWPAAVTVAAVAAIGESAVSRLDGPGLAAEGMLILGYLLMAGAPPAMPRRLTVPWARRQAPLGTAGLVAAGAVLAALALRPATSLAMVLIGLAAAIAAYVLALRRGPRRDEGTGDGMPGKAAGP